MRHISTFFFLFIHEDPSNKICVFGLVTFCLAPVCKEIALPLGEREGAKRQAELRRIPHPILTISFRLKTLKFSYFEIMLSHNGLLSWFY